MSTSSDLSTVTLLLLSLLFLEITEPLSYNEQQEDKIARRIAMCAVQDSTMLFLGWVLAD
jgi:hypothetical protein